MLRTILAVATLAGILYAIRRLETAMSTLADANTKLDELVKDVRRVLAKVSATPQIPADVQADIDALNARLDSLDTEVETADPEQPATPDTPAGDNATV